MEKMDELLERMLDRCAATGVSIIRMSNGEILFLKNRSKLPNNIIELACNAAYEMFNGNTMKNMLETVLQHISQEGKTTYLDSVRFTFSNAFHWMTLLKGEYIIVLTAPKTGISPGYTETLFRSFLPRIGALLP